MPFVNRETELERLREWWARSPGTGSLGIVWGRRRIGKTELIRQFATRPGRRAIFHTSARRPVPDELRVFSAEVASALDGGFRDLASRPFGDWTDAFEFLAAAAPPGSPLLVVLDEFPELTRISPEIASLLRACWDRVRSKTALRLLLCGSAVRVMENMQEEREPLYGRFDLLLPLHPFRPHEAALMLPDLPPVERAAVWAILGGVPQYLGWWDQERSVAENIEALACTPGGRLLVEGDLILASEGGSDLGEQVLYAVGSGRTKFAEIKDAVRTDPTRSLERLRASRLVDRFLPVTEDERTTRRRLYRIADNFLAFSLSVLSRHRSQIELGLGRSILPVLMRELDDFSGPRWEEAFRWHLRRLADDGQLGDDVVAIGPFWTSSDDEGQNEIDAVALAGRERAAVLVGEARWARRVDGARATWEMERKARALPRVRPGLRFAAAAREEVRGGDERLLRVTAADVFA